MSLLVIGTKGQFGWVLASSLMPRGKVIAVAVRGNNFVKTVLRLTRERDELNFFADQFCALTCARNIADATMYIVRQLLQKRVAAQYSSVIFNPTNSGKIAWHGLARTIVASQLSVQDGMDIALTQAGVHQ